MPQLDTVTYLSQYSWTLVCLFFLFSLLVSIVLPRLQQQLRARANLGPSGLKEGGPEVLVLRPLFRKKGA